MAERAGVSNFHVTFLTDYLQQKLFSLDFHSLFIPEISFPYPLRVLKNSLALLTNFLLFKHTALPKAGKKNSADAPFKIASNGKHQNTMKITLKKIFVNYPIIFIMKR